MISVACWVLRYKYWGFFLHQCNRKFLVSHNPNVNLKQLYQTEFSNEYLVFFYFNVFILQSGADSRVMYVIIVATVYEKFESWKPSLIWSSDILLYQWDTLWGNLRPMMKFVWIIENSSKEVFIPFLKNKDIFNRRNVYTTCHHFGHFIQSVLYEYE